MSGSEHKMPEPVAWRCNWYKRGKIAWVQYHDEIDPLPGTWDARPNETLPLYSADTVRELQTEVERLKYDAGTSASVATTMLAENAALRAERDALAENAARMLGSLRGAVLALARASESDQAYAQDYQHVSDTIEAVAAHRGLMKEQGQ